MFELKLVYNASRITFCFGMLLVHGQALRYLRRVNYRIRVSGQPKGKPALTPY